MVTRKIMSDRELFALFTSAATFASNARFFRSIPRTQFVAAPPRSESAMAHRA